MHLPVKLARLTLPGPNNWFHVSQTRWGDWVEPYSTRKSWIMQQMWQTARSSSSKTASSSLPAAMGYAAAMPAQGLNGGGCVGSFFFSFGWIFQASSTWINLVNGAPSPIPSPAHSATSR